MVPRPQGAILAERAFAGLPNKESECVRAVKFLSEFLLIAT